MNYVEQILNRINQNNGVITSQEVSELGIPRMYLSKLVEENRIIRAERGVYVLSSIKNDELYILSKRYKNIIYSHETSLFLLDKIPNKPIAISVTVMSGSNTSTYTNKGLKVYSIKKELLYCGVIRIATKYGNEVYCYDYERTICDLIRSRKRINNDALIKLIAGYVSSNDQYDNKNLLAISEMMKVKNILQNYMQVFE